jgi:hypothetical protein
MEWQVERAKRSDLLRVSSFFKQQFQGPQRYGRADMFAWKTFENTTQEGFINLIKDGNVIAATTSMVPKKIFINNKPILGGEIGDTYVATNYRREGLFPILGNATRKQAQEEGLQFIYGLPNNLALPGWLKRANFLLTKNLNIRSLVFPFSAKLKFQRLAGWFLAEPLDALYRIIARIYIASKKPQISNSRLYSTEIIEAFPTDWDEFWTHSAKNFDFIIDRSSEQMEWRYIKNPEKYSIVTVRHQGNLIGYCIYRNVLIEGGLDIILADYLFLDGHENALNLCLSQIFKFSFLTSIRSLNVWCDITSPYYDIFRKYGLIDQNEIPVIVHCNDLTEEFDKSSRVHFTIGDSDNV